uniref:Synaptobrevin, longin-like domain protein n=1 Tax=Tanacetum cinerariifolium TaxID=118510 RepID=A0A6L2JL29_TANCI|nr:synaptobrevin, longin-like domain protein [Tanacetum cinerariifolium]
MAVLRYKDEHNKVGYLLKPTGSDDYHQIIDFLRAYHIRYALTHNPIIFDSLVKQFWSTASLRSPELGPPAIQATIDKTPYTITEDLVRSQLQLANDGGIYDLPIAEIYFGMDNLEYVTEGNLNFFKNKFSPQWRFLVHTILHCLSTKSGSWDQFGSLLAVALICLSDGRQFNWSSYIFKGMADADPFTNVEDEPLGGSFHMSLPRSTQAPPTGQTSGGAEDLITPTALSSVVFTLVQKVNSLETELKDHKKLFKDVVGKLVKKVKAIEVKLRTTKKKMDVSDSDQKEGGKQDVDLDALLALANAVTVDSNISPGGASDNLAASTSVSVDVPTSVNVPTGSTSVPTDVPTSVAPAGVSNKGKTPMVEEDINVKERIFKQMQKDRLGEQTAKRLHDEEQAHVDRQRADVQRRRQQEVLASAMYYTEADWINIMAQVEANASLSKTLLGDDVSEDNFLAKIAALIKRKQQALAEKLAKEMRNRPMTQGQQRTYMRQFVKNQKFEKIQKTISNIQIQAFSRTLKRTGPVLKEPFSKRQKSTEAHIPSVPKVPQSPVVSSPKSSGTKRKSLGRKRLPQPKSKLKELYLDADAQTFIKVVSNEDSDDEAPILWSALIGWEFITTPLGDINALYRIDRSTKHFTTLRQILHMVDRHDLVKLYGLVVKYYEHHPVAGARLILLGDLQVLFDSHEGDVPYPFLVHLMERMLKHKLGIDKDVVCNDMTTAEQLIQSIKNQLAAAQVFLLDHGSLKLYFVYFLLCPTCSLLYKSIWCSLS